MRGKVEFAPSHELKAADEDVLRLFFTTVLNLDYDRCLVTDESSLHHFAPCGLPDTNAEYDSIQALHAAWDEWIIEAVRRHYGITLETPAILLVDLVKRLPAPAF